MKFGRQFDFHKIPEWSEFYFDYKALKKELKRIQQIRRKHWKRKTLSKLREAHKIQKKVFDEISQTEITKNKEQIQRFTLAVSSTKELKENLISKRKISSPKMKIINRISAITDEHSFLENSPSQKPKIDSVSPDLLEFKLESNIVSINFSNSDDDQSIIVQNPSLKNLNHNTSITLPLDEYEIEALQLKSDFICLYKEKMKIVNKFYVDKINEITNDFLKLKNKMKNRKQTFIEDSMVVKDVNFSKSMIHKMKKENAERDELGFAVSWKRALSQLYNTASWLNSYLTINNIANQKIIKKMERVFKNSDMPSGKEEIEEITKSFNFSDKNEQVIKVSKNIKEFYSEELTDKDKHRAKKELEERMKGNRSKDIVTIAFYSGMIISFLLSFFLLSQIPKTVPTDDSIFVFFPAFNFVFIIALILVGLAINIMVFRKYRINYIYIFEIDPNLRMGHNEILRIFLFLMNVWLILLLFTESSLSFNILTTKFYIYPMILLCFFTIFMLLPFHFFYYNFRKGIIITLIKNILPLGKNGVRFRDFMFGDILTSLTRPFATLCLSMCLLSCSKCRDENIRQNCTRNSVKALVLILSPFVIRFFQCLNRFYYTKMAWPHIGNAIKYLGGITFNFFSWMYAVYKQEYFYHFLISACLANGYMLFWDIYMDWNLARNFSNNFFLRDKIVYPKWMYYFAIVTNSLLRLTWLTSLPGVNLYVNDETKLFILSILEIYRRSQWSLFRVENENTNNPEKYRTILDIPKLPIDD